MGSQITQFVLYEVNLYNRFASRLTRSRWSLYFYFQGNKIMDISETKKSKLWLVFFASLLTCTNTMAEAEIEWVLEGDLSRITFEDEIFSGNTPHVGLTVALVFESQYEIGFTTNGSFLFTPSLSKGSDQLNDDDLFTEVNMLYLQRNWLITDKITGLALLGYSEIEIESEDIQSNCLILFTCSNPVTSTTTYRNKESGFAWGIGIRRETESNYYLSLKYVDYSNGDIDFSGLHFGLGIVF